MKVRDTVEREEVIVKDDFYDILRVYTVPGTARVRIRTPPRGRGTSVTTVLRPLY